jgi:hypothetical protein
MDTASNPKVDLSNQEFLLADYIAPNGLEVRVYQYLHRSNSVGTPATLAVDNSSTIKNSFRYKWLHILSHGQ